MSSERRKKFSLGDVIQRLSEAGDSVVPDPEHPPEQSPKGTSASDAQPARQPVPPTRARPDASAHVPPQKTHTPGPLPPSPPSPPSLEDREKDEEEFDVWRYIAIVLRHRKVIIATMLLAAAYATYSYFSAPRYYVAHARLLFSPGYQQIGGDYPSAWRSWMNNERLFHTHLELIRSRAVLELLAENLDGRISPGALAGRLAIKRGQTDGKDNDIFEISFQHPDAHLAQDVVNELCRTYIEYRRQVNAQEQTRLILKLEGQIAKLERELTATEDTFRVFKEHNRMVRLTDETNNVVSRVANMEVALQQTQLDLAETKERLTALRSSIGQQEVNVVQSMTYDNAYQNRLADLELQLSTLSAEYSAEHYKVRMLRQEIDTLKQAMESDVQSRVARQTTFVKNPVRQSLLSELVQLTIHKSALETRRTAQEGLIEKLNTELAGLPSIEQRYVALQRETVLLEETLKLLKSEYEHAKIARDSQESDLRIFELAPLPKAQVSDEKPVNILIGIAVGLLLGIGLAFALEYLDQTVKTPGEVEKMLEAPILGFVPYIEAEMALLKEPKDLAKTVIEPFRAVRANLKHLLQQYRLHALMVCSAVKGEGKTTLAANLAVTFVLDGRRVILIDGDLRRPQMHRLFGLPKETGVSEYLQGTCDVDALLKETRYANLSVVTAGSQSPHPAELLGSPRFATLMQQLRERCDLLLLDSPALLPVSDVITMAPYADAALVVARTLWTPAKAAKQALNQLKRIGVHILGGVVNGVSHSRGYYPYYYGYYGYYSYRYGYEDGGGGGKGSLREVGLRFESRIREQVQNLRYSLPRLTMRTRHFLRSCARQPLLWILLAVLLGLTALDRRLAVSDPGKGNTAIERLDETHPPPVENTSAPADGEVSALDAAGPVEPCHELSECFASWQSAFESHDRIALAAFYRIDSITWTPLDGTSVKGEKALRAVLSLNQAYSIIDSELSCDETPAADTCTVHASVVGKAGGAQHELLSVWYRHDDTWLIQRQELRERTAP